MRTQILRLVRGFDYAISYILFEYPRGLDFSRRNKSQVSLLSNHGYALTSKKALRNILSHIDFKGKRFLDIGSGKGGVICFAHELGLAWCEGIEYEPHLHDIAVQNIRRLGYEASICSTHIDAREFNRYAEFDIYFMFNPFDDDVYAQVLSEIIEQNKRALPQGRDKFLICYGAANLDAVTSSCAFSLVTEERCPYRGNKYRIYALTDTIMAGKPEMASGLR